MYACLEDEVTEDEKCHNIMSWLNYFIMMMIFLLSVKKTPTPPYMLIISLTVFFFFFFFISKGFNGTMPTSISEPTTLVVESQSLCEHFKWDQIFT